MNNEPTRFRDQWVVITGGSSGIGLATARMFAAQGAHVAILARNPQRLAAAAESIRAARVDLAQQVRTAAVDVAEYPALAQAAEEILAAAGAPAILVNSAGVARPGLMETMAVEQFHRMMDVNYYGTVHAIKAFLPAMIARQTGHIVNICSGAGFMALYGYTAYGASKFAIKGLSDALRLEMKAHNIRVSVVFPPDTDTPQLVEDNRYKPPVLIAAEEGSQLLSADQVAQSILRGIQRKRYVITPGWMMGAYFHLAGLTGGGLLYTIMDLIFADAHRKVRRNPGKYQNQHVG